VHQKFKTIYSKTEFFAKDNFIPFCENEQHIKWSTESEKPNPLKSFTQTISSWLINLPPYKTEKSFN
jgi:hypothetical protein